VYNENDENVDMIDINTRDLPDLEVTDSDDDSASDIAVKQL
jgi:hypothetical protein